LFEEVLLQPTNNKKMVNSPFPSNLAEECRKAARTIRSFTIPENTNSIDSIIPHDIIRRAKGLVVMTVAKAGFLFSARVGFGLVVARLPDGSWSAPSGIGTGSFGAGLQAGIELTDFVIILNNDSAVNAFTHGGNVALGGNLSVAAGPIGRNAEGAAMATIAATYSYSKTKGIFAGISLEGTVFIERKESNSYFYGREVTSRQLLKGEVAPPDTAAPLYEALMLRETKGREIQEQEFAKMDQMRSQSTSAPPSYSSAPPTAYSSNTYASTTTTTNRTSGVPRPTSTVGAPQPTPRLPPRGNPSARALYDFNPQQPGDLGFKAGEIIEIVERTQNQNDWWKGRVGGRTGSFPANYVQML